MAQGTQQDFMNMIQDYESHEFRLCWINFLEKYPNSKYPENYAEWEWQQTWAEE
jgi:hypothetical protein